MQRMWEQYPRGSTVTPLSNAPSLQKWLLWEPQMLLQNLGAHPPGPICLLLSSLCTLLQQTLCTDVIYTHKGNGLPSSSCLNQQKVQLSRSNSVPTSSEKPCPNTSARSCLNSLSLNLPCSQFTAQLRTACYSHRDTCHSKVPLSYSGIWVVLPRGSQILSGKQKYTVFLSLLPSKYRNWWTEVGIKIVTNFTQLPIPWNKATFRKLDIPPRKWRGEPLANVWL